MAFASSVLAGSGAGLSRPTELIVLRGLVALNRATLKPRLRRIPVSQVQLVSLERIVLSVPAIALE
jgi:hypothetical protein